MLRKIFEKINIQKTTTTKLIVWVLLVNSIAWVWCSYLFAWMGKEEIAETLSRYIVTEIISVFAVYGFKSLLENISKYTGFFEKHSSKDKIDAE